jgi:hypothetical protein
MKENALNSAFSNYLTNVQMDLIWGMGLSKIDIAVRLDVTNSSIENDTSVGPAHNEARGDGFVPGDPYPFGALFVANRIVNSGVEINTFGVTPAIALHMSNDNRLRARSRSATIRSTATPRRPASRASRGRTMEACRTR